MTDKVQKIREEVERMHNLLPVMDGDNISVNYADRICTTLEMYIDSLQEEPVSEDLEKVAELYTLDDKIKPWRNLTKEAFIAGAKWKKQQTISKACKWIEERAARYVVDRFVGSTRMVGIDTSITEDFRKDMED